MGVGQIFVGFGKRYGVLCDNAAETVTAAGAASVTKILTKCELATASYGVSLADGAFAGQRKLVKVTTLGGAYTLTLTPANLADGTSYALATLQDLWLGMWDGAAWQTLYASVAVTP